MRKKFNLTMCNWVSENAKDYTAKELIDIVKEKFNEEFTLKQMQQYLFHHDIKYKYEMPKKAHSNIGLSIGSERTKGDGMVQIKTGAKKWEYKQRKIYQDYYGVELKDNEYIIFLDGNRNNFDINNLEKVTCQEAGYMANQKLYTKDIEATKVSVNIAKLALKTYAMQHPEHKPTSHHKRKEL